MKEHSVRFTTGEVQEILKDKKTQFKRVVKPQPYKEKFWYTFDIGNKPPSELGNINSSIFQTNSKNEMKKHLEKLYCPFGKTDDELWVKEVWSQNLNPISDNYGGDEYLADYEGVCFDIDEWIKADEMPRWASRIQLIIKDVKVELTQDLWVWVVEFEIK